MNFSTKLNLSKLKSAIVKLNGKSGPVECIAIPINANHLYKGEKGIYLDLSHIEIKNPAPDQTDTHLVKQNLPKDVYNALSDDEKKNTPILGNTKTWETTYDAPQEDLAPSQELNEELPF